jgi:hypothetical protein
MFRLGVLAGRVLPAPWLVGVLVLGAVALVVLWWRFARQDAGARGEPYGRVVPLTPAERNGWSEPTFPSGERTAGGGDA